MERAESEDLAQQVAARIRELRMVKGLSVRELARRSGLPPESVSRSERAITEITLTSLGKLCTGLGMDLPQFFDFAAKQGEHRSPAANRLALLLSDLEPKQARQVGRGIEILLHGLRGDRVTAQKGAARRAK